MVMCGDKSQEQLIEAEGMSVSNMASLCAAYSQSIAECNKGKKGNLQNDSFAYIHPIWHITDARMIMLLNLFYYL